MTKSNIVRLVATVLVAAVAVFADLDIEHPAWAKSLAFWQPQDQRDIALHYGVDLQGGLSVLLAADVPEEQQALPALMEASQAIIRSRARSLTIADPVVQMIDSHHILVTMPDIEDIHLVTETLQAEGLIEFVNVGATDPSTLRGTTLETIPGAPPTSPIPTPASIGGGTTTPIATLTASVTPTATATLTATITPTVTVTAPVTTPTTTTTAPVAPTTTLTLAETLTPTATTTPTVETTSETSPSQVYERVLTDDDLKSVELKHAAPNAYGFSEPYIEFVPTQEGATALDMQALTYPGQYLCMTIDKKVVAGAQLPEQSSQLFTSHPGPFRLGAFTYGTEAKSTEAILRSGQLPVPLKVENIRAAEPTLGQAAVKRIGSAAIIGLAAALVLLPAHYRFPGLLADLALFIFGLIGLALCKLIPLPLTLASITGFAMAALLALRVHLAIFERLREELRADRPLPKAVENSFSHTWPSIRDSHITLLLVSIVVWTTGAATAARAIHWMGAAMAAGVVASVFVTLVVTRLFMSLASNVSWDWLNERRWLLEA